MIPCGKVMGHGERCSDGWLCGDCRDTQKLLEENALFKQIAFSLAMIDRDYFTEHDEALLDEAIELSRDWYERYGKK
jgi:hypothetical protein